MKLICFSKAVLRRVLSFFGVKVTFIRRPSETSKSHQVVRIGKFEILMNSSPLVAIYKNQPNYSSELGRLAAATEKKYPSMIVIDVGANVGDTVAVVRSMIEIPIICIEGDANCFALLEKNIRQFKNVTAHKLFLGERTENIQAKLEKATWNTTIIPQVKNSNHMVELVSLDEFLEKNPYFAECKLLKIDAEGFDCKILKGGMNFIRHVKPVIMFEYNRSNMDVINEDGIETLNMLCKMGYSSISFYDHLGRLVLSTSTDNFDLINDLHSYIDGNHLIRYYDVCLFHREDQDVAYDFQRMERQKFKACSNK